MQSDKQKKLISFLTKELGSKESVKRFSSELKELGICDLSQSKTQEFIMTQEGAAYLFTLVTHYNFGLLNKLIEIKRNINEHI